MPRDLKHYQALPYTRRCQLEVEDGNRYWHAWIEELPGCEIDGASKAEAYGNLEEVFADYIKAKLEWDSPIPEPEKWMGQPQEVPTNVMWYRSGDHVIEKMVIVRRNDVDATAPNVLAGELITAGT